MDIRVEIRALSGRGPFFSVRYLLLDHVANSGITRWVHGLYSTIHIQVCALLWPTVCCGVRRATCLITMWMIQQSLYNLGKRRSHRFIMIRTLRFRSSSRQLKPLEFNTSWRSWCQTSTTSCLLVTPVRIWPLPGQKPLHWAIDRRCACACWI